MMLFEPCTVHVPYLSFISTAMAPLMAGHKVKFANVDKNTLTMNVPYEVNENDILLPVHFGGLPCDIEGTDRIIEDAAHAMGSRLSTKNMKCFSFHATKNLNMPNGGAIALYNDEHIDKLKAMRWCGLEEKKGKRDVKTMGLNYVMNDISAVMGIEQLKTLDRDNKRRFEIALEYNSRLTPFKFFRMMIEPNCSYHIYWVLVKNRDEFRAKMAKAGIETGIHYPPINKFSLFKENIKQTITDHIVTLPIHPCLKTEDLDRVIKSANSSV